MPDWKLRCNLPDRPTLASPLELVIEQAPASRPSKVIIELWESDARNYEVDDYTDSMSKKSPKDRPRDGDDLVVSFEGTLRPHESRPKGALFTPTATRPQFNAEQGSDHVGVLFEGQPSSSTVEVAIPRSGVEPVYGVSDGEFYELFFLIRDHANPDAEPLAVSAVQIVRRRTDVLLFVEPLCQGSSSLNTPMGEMTLDYFHGGEKSTKNRNWGSTIIALRDGVPMFLQESGCSVVSMTMLIRYLRVKVNSGVTPATTGWETLYERIVAGLSEPHRPLASKGGAVEIADLAQKDGLVFIPRAGEIEGLAQRIRETDARLDPKKSKGKKTPISKSPASWANTAPAEGLKSPSTYFIPAPVPAHHWPTHLIWWMRQHSNTTSDLSDFERGQLRWTLHLKDRTTEISPMVDRSGQPIWQYRFHPDANPSFCSEDWKPVPPTADLNAALGMSHELITLSSDNASDWAKRLKAHIARGLPAIAHFKSGRYQLNSGGHYTLVVGYRQTAGVTRFIINDPSGAKKMQYEAPLERDLVPTEAKRDEVTSVDLLLLDADGKKQLAQASWNLAALNNPPPQPLPATLSDGTTLELQSRYIEPVGLGDFATSLGGLRIEVREGTGAPRLLEISVSRNSKKSTFSSKEAAYYMTSTGHNLQIRVNGEYRSSAGPRLPQPWEGRWDVLIERRKHMSMCNLYLMATREPWETGAARFVRFDGEALDE